MGASIHNLGSIYDTLRSLVVLGCLRHIGGFQRTLLSDDKEAKKNSTRSHPMVKGIAVKWSRFGVQQGISVSDKVAKARTSHLGSCTLRTKQLHLLPCLGCWFLLRVMYFVPSHESTGHIEGGDMSGILTTRSRWHCLVPGRYRITLATTILVASAKLPNPNISPYHQSCWLVSLRRPNYSRRGNKVYSLFHGGTTDVRLWLQL